MLFQLINLKLKDELEKILSNTSAYLAKNPDRAIFHQKLIKFLEDQLRKLNSYCQDDLGYQKLIETFFEQYNQYNTANNNELSSVSFDAVKSLFREAIREHQKQMELQAQLEQLKDENKKLNESLVFIAESNLQKFVAQMQTVTSQAHAAARQATDTLKRTKPDVASPAYSSLFPVVVPNPAAVDAGVVSAANAMDTTTPTSSQPVMCNN